MADSLMAGNGQQVVHDTLESVNMRPEVAGAIVPGAATDRNEAIAMMAATGNMMGKDGVELADGRSYDEAKSFAGEDADKDTVIGLAYFLDVRKTMDRAAQNTPEPAEPAAQTAAIALPAPKF